MQDDLGAGRQARVALDVLRVDGQAGGATGLSTRYWVETPMKPAWVIRPVMRLRPSGTEAASSAWVRVIFSGRMPTSSFSPVRAVAVHRVAGRASLVSQARRRMSSPEVSRTSAAMRLEVPRKLATKVVRGVS
ncbi:hypothetical protein GCM10020000_22200 [Streptomyces olivoverticillatus]